MGPKTSKIKDGNALETLNIKIGYGIGSDQRLVPIYRGCL
jgi:hypothetical protein